MKLSGHIMLIINKIGSVLLLAPITANIMIFVMLVDFKYVEYTDQCVSFLPKSACKQIFDYNYFNTKTK